LTSPDHVPSRRIGRSARSLRHSTDFSVRQRETPYLDALAAYRDVGYTSFATPGHKRGKGAPAKLVDVLGPAVLSVDAARAGGVDDTRESSGFMAAAECLAAEAYGADRAWFLVNGSTSGVHALVLGLASPGDCLVVPRNSHKSMLAAFILSGVVPHYVEPVIHGEWQIPLGVTPEDLASAVAQRPEARAVFVASPNMYGVCADLTGLAEVAHTHGLPCVVDQAWGPHLRFCSRLPVDAMQADADASVTSIHKLCSGLTQSSVLLARGPRVDLERLAQVALMTQSTSPQALIYASIDAARQQLVTQGEELWGRALERAEWARRQIDELPGLAVFGEAQCDSDQAFEIDRTRLTIGARGLGLSGYELETLLRCDYRVIVEMSDPLNVVCNITHADTSDDLRTLVGALAAISQRYCGDCSPSRVLRCAEALTPPRFAGQVLSPREAFFSASRAIPTKDAAGETAAEMVTPYPPGVPVLGPGEAISDEIVAYLLAGAEMGLHVHGPRDASLRTIRVVDQ